MFVKDCFPAFLFEEKPNLLTGTRERFAGLLDHGKLIDIANINPDLGDP